MIALYESHQAGLFRREHWLSNIVSGIIVGVVALPLAMAFAIASGLRPEQGIYTAIIAGIIVSSFGGSRLQIAGPTGAFIVILSGITAKHGVDGLLVATVMAGIILVLFGLAKLGTIIKFIPSPVIVGFTSGIAVIIWVGQWKDFFGLPKVAGKHFHNVLLHTLEVFPQLHVETTALALLSLFLVVFSPKIISRIPGPLIAMVAATIVQYFFQFDNVSTIGSAFGGIPQSLPSLSPPEITFGRIVEMIGPAFIIAMLGAIESLLSAVVADGMAGTKHNSNQELIGQGIANIVAPFFGGFAATGAIARTATNIRNGGTGPLAGIVHSLTLVLIILLLAPLASNIPLCSLAAILFVVAWNMSEVHRFFGIIRKAPRNDVIILLVTFFLTVFADLVVAVNIGVILAALMFMRRMAQAVEVVPQKEEDISEKLKKMGLKKLPKDVLVYQLDGPFFFGAAENFERTLAGIHSDPRILILRLERVPFIDITGLQALEEAIHQFKKRSTDVILCEASERVRKKLEDAEVPGAASSQQSLAEALAQSEPTEESRELADYARQFLDITKSHWLKH